MKVKYLRIESDDLEPNDSGYPKDWEDFDIRMEVDLCFENMEADSVFFEFYVANKKGLQRRDSNSFLAPTLILDEFNWNIIKEKVEKLLLHTKRSKNWIEVAAKLSGFMRPASFDCFPWEE